MKLEKEGLVVTPLTEQKTGLWDMAFIWFCANVAVPRLMIGGSLAELGFGKMILILIAGNILVFPASAGAGRHRLQCSYPHHGCHPHDLRR